MSLLSQKILINKGLPDCRFRSRLATSGWHKSAALGRWQQRTASRRGWISWSKTRAFCEFYDVGMVPVLERVRVRALVLAPER